MKALEKTKNFFRKIKYNAFRFWNWKKKSTDTQFQFSVPANRLVEITNLPEAAMIEKFRIEFSDRGDEKKRQFKIKNKKFVRCVFSHKVIENFNFMNCTFDECSFTGAFIVECEFHKCTFDDCSFYKTKISTTYLDPKSFKYSPKWHWDFANINSWFFQVLYRNSLNMHQEEFAMHADKRFQFYRRYEYLRGNNPRPLKFFWNLLFDYILGYGYGILNAAILTFITIISFALLITNHLKDTKGDFWKALYFTVVSFTTVGYGDVTPNFEPWSISLTILFLIASVVWCAVVTAIIVKRIVR